MDCLAQDFIRWVWSNGRLRTTYNIAAGQGHTVFLSPLVISLTVVTRHCLFVCLLARHTGAWFGGVERGSAVGQNRNLD